MRHTRRPTIDVPYLVQVHRMLAIDGIDERIREIQENKRLLFDHIARRSETKESDARAVAVDTSVHGPLCSTTSRCRSSEECFWRNNTGWGWADQR